MIYSDKPQKYLWLGQKGTTMGEKKTTKPVHLAGIVAVFEAEGIAEVSHTGKKIGQAKVTIIRRRGWRCRPCSVDFQQWRAVLSHLQVHDQEATTAQGLHKATTEDIVHFAQEVLGVTMYPEQVAVAQGILNGQVVLRWRHFGHSLAAKVAMEMMKAKPEVKHSTLILLDEIEDFTQDQDGAHVA